MLSPLSYALNRNWQVVQDETFAPILYVLPYQSLAEAIAIQKLCPSRTRPPPSSRTTFEKRKHSCPLSAVIAASLTSISVLAARRLAVRSAARRTRVADGKAAAIPGKPICGVRTVTINYSPDLPLAQGIRFE